MVKPDVTEQNAPVRAPADGFSVDGAEISEMLEKRSQQRVTIELSAEIMLDSDVINCSTVDLSSGGAKIKIPEAFFQNVMINIANTGGIKGDIKWIDGEYFGIKFEEEQSEIVKVLSRLTS